MTAGVCVQVSGPYDGNIDCFSCGNTPNQNPSIGPAENCNQHCDAPACKWVDIPTGPPGPTGPTGPKGGTVTVFDIVLSIVTGILAIAVILLYVKL
jgi:hypothetical protein